jgi:putative N6-adenine-specific DNA methylase
VPGESSESLDLNLEFYLVVPPGFEHLAEKELKALIPEISVKAGFGGLTVTCSRETGFALNRILKIPTRVLLRIARFKTRDFPKLFKKVNEIPWQNWLKHNVPVDFKASSEASRLFLKKRIEQTCAEAFDKRVKFKKDAPLSAPIEVMVRVFEDECTVSLDLSGEPLYKRGVKTWVSEAPLRENLAAGLLWFLASENGRTDINTVDFESIELIDPMMGSGTFLIEAASLLNEVRSREFAFENLKLEGELAHLRFKDFSADSAFKHLRGFEIDQRAFQIANENLKNENSKSLTGVQITLENQSSGDVKFSDGELNRWLVLNPPYGERLKIEGPLSQYYSSLWGNLEKSFRPSRVCCICPEKATPTKIKPPKEWVLKEALKFKNGGLPVQALLFVRRPSRVAM